MKKTTHSLYGRFFVLIFIFNLVGIIFLSSLTPFLILNYKAENNNLTFNENNPIDKTPKASSGPIIYKFNRQAAYGYAYKWWNDYNNHYNDYSGSGGDCANYVSQCLIAGGLSLHNGTDGTGYGVYPDRDRASLSNGTISYCDYLNTHLRNYQKTNVTFVTEAAAYVPDEITIGDVVIFGEELADNWEHAMIVVWDGGIEIGLAGHSSSIWNRTFTEEIGFATFDCATFYHINDTEAEFYHFKVDTAVLNVRVGPGMNNLSTNYQDIGDLHEGEEYVAFEYEFDEGGKKWWHFWFDDRSAWTASWFTVNVSGNRIIEVDINNYLNVRDGPGTGYSIYGQVYNGMRFISDMSDGSWYRFWYGGAQKYSHGSYLDEISLFTRNFSKPVMGFLPYWVSNTQNYSVISHLAWFAVEMNSDGTIGLTHGWPEWDIINDVHNEGNKIILTVTMFDSIDIHTMLTSYRTTAVNNLLAQVQAGNADGICIDFEHPKQGGDDVLLVQFMQTLSDTFKSARNDYHISLCTPSVDWWGTYDYGSIAPYVDAFMLMGYGYYWSGSANAGPTSPLEGGNYYINKSVNDHIDEGAPKSKIILGLPYYGYDWPVSNTNKNAPATGPGSSRTYSAVQGLISTYSPTIYYDDVAECAWFNYNDGQQRQLWFDNYTSLERKLDYIFDRDLGGLGIWAYGYQGIYTELEQLLVDKFSIDTPNKYPPGPFIINSDAGNPDKDGNFNLYWNISSGAEYYTVYRSDSEILTAGSGTAIIPDLPINTTLVTNITDGTYFFAVVAYNDTGSTLSNNLEITVLISDQKDKEKDEKSITDDIGNQFDIIGFITSPFGMLIIGLGGGFLIGFLFSNKRAKSKEKFDKERRGDYLYPK